jgi:diguanylate cyclase (GGDEF)-like protein
VNEAACQMDHSILESVIKITNQRDVDSLEYSLVATLAEMVTFSEVGIYKLVDDGNQSYLEEVVKLKFDENRQPEEALEWTENSNIIARDQNIQECLDTGLQIPFYENDRLTRLIMPITCDKKVVAAVNLNAKIDLTPYAKMLEGMIRIYENYLFILDESEKDKLTGLFNRRTFDKKLDRLLQIQRNQQIRLIESQSDKEQRSLKPHSETWLAMIDIDDFKKINDSHGHVFGDAVLSLLAHKMKLCFRQADYLFRFGGEEFVVILEPHPKEQAYITLERFRAAIAEHDFPLVGRVTVSIGYAKIIETDYPPAILDSADKALYYSKTHGKNTIYNYETLVKDQMVEKTCIGSSINTG